MGKLHSDSELGDLLKKSIPPEDKSKLSKFLIRDKQAFEEYAIQDAVICLKHALSRERFNLSIYQLGVPLTL